MNPTGRTPTPHDDDPFDELGAAYSRRRLLALLGGGAAAALAGGAVLTRWSTASATTVPDSTTDTVIPEETAGPYPADGSNGPNVLDDDGIVRRDITASYDIGSAVAEGVPLVLELVVVDVAAGTPLEGAAVYAWHCDRDGNYSLYSQGLESENYLRGVQAADADGLVAFDSIFPGCYSGRWPHIHFEVYPSTADAVAGTNRLATSQVALPQDTCEVVYATDGYEDSVGNLAQTSLTRDNVFGDDGAENQLATMTGSVEDGFTARLVVGV